MTPKRFDLDDAYAFKFLPGVRAANPNRVRLVRGFRPFPVEAQSLLEVSNDLIRENTSKPMSFLYALSSAPRYAFNESPLLPWRTKSLFNPRGLMSNCMGCTAGVLRTLQSGILTTADDVTHIVGSNGARPGEPRVGRFENESEALDWFQEAAGVRIVNSVASTSELQRGRTYALTLNLNPRSGSESLHMGFAHAFEDWRRVFFDGQSGVQWEGESFHDGLPVRFYELQFSNNK